MSRLVMKLRGDSGERRPRRLASRSSGAQSGLLVVTTINVRSVTHSRRLASSSKTSDGVVEQVDRYDVIGPEPIWERDVIAIERLEPQVRVLFAR